MLKPMPVGKPRPYNVKKGLDNLFGIALAEITVPTSVKYPMIPFKRSGKDHLIFPHGKIKAHYFSEELKFAVSKGCTVKLISAWEYDRSDDLFKGFVEQLYDLKKNSNGSVRLLSKLILNSLYGKMGQSREYLGNIITNNPELMDEIEKKYTDIKSHPIKNGYISYQYSLAPNKHLKQSDKNLYNKLEAINKLANENKLGNIAIALAISATARVEIFSKIYKLNSMGINIAYMDTDALVTDKPIPRSMLGNEIGQFKNELADSNYTIEDDYKYHMKDAVFLRDKVYGYKNMNDEIKIKFSGLNKSSLTDQLYLEMLEVVEGERESILSISKAVSSEPVILLAVVSGLRPSE